MLFNARLWALIGFGSIILSYALMLVVPAYMERWLGGFGAAPYLLGGLLFTMLFYVIDMILELCVIPTIKYAKRRRVVIDPGGPIPTITHFGGIKPFSVSRTGR